MLAPDAGIIHLLTDIDSPTAFIVDKAEDHDLTVVGTQGSWDHR